uniref:AlNc14C19G1963 protein n=1 Tax=Albugo laibachii Nc14 TaxID=890382 RepID=F0W4Z3_9STRA|nr:AlNc14C19G1963 [Albugo laibachii Nc14]|eukprot:CCA16183.1 AlNc14C19G1963 [Albugo laibachii Nc14]
MIALQETRLSNDDNQRKNDRFIRIVDANARVFWFPISEASGHNGVGLILSSHHPFGPIVNVTSLHINQSVHDPYLLLDTSIMSQRIWMHVVYAPSHLPERLSFFQSLPHDGPAGLQHIVLGDFDVPLNPTLDSSKQRHSGADIEALPRWTMQMGLTDAWRTTHPYFKEYTGPRRRNRIDYCFLSSELLRLSDPDRS